MHPAILRLLDLQTAEQRIAAIRAELDAIPKRLQEAEAVLASARAAVTAAKEAHSVSLRERKKFELDVEQWKERVHKYRDQSSAVKTNEAYKALQQEIGNAEAEITKAEDRQLEAMMAAEEVERRMKSAEAALKQAEPCVALRRKAVQEQEAEKRKELEVALAERQRLVAPVPEDLLNLYTRMAKRHHGIALAEARDEQCRSCGMRILPHVYQQLRREDNDEIFHCETCGRLFYILEPVTPKSAPASDKLAASSAPHSS